MKPNIINTEQFEYWNEKSGPKWVKYDDAMNERFSILIRSDFEHKAETAFSHLLSLITLIPSDDN